MDLTSHWVGLVTLSLFTLAYAVVISEEKTGIRKSMPVLLAAGLIWALIAAWYARNGGIHETEEALERHLVEFAELFLFLLTAMTYLNAMSERNVFASLRSWLVRKNLTYRQLFWITGIMAFFLSPIIDNLTTALVMCAVVLAIGQGNTRFVAPACVNLVVAANAGGAFSPFGDITTLMVWQRGIVDFTQFFALFVPSVVNFLVPAAIMSLFIPREVENVDETPVPLKRGARRIMALFGVTIALAVSFHNFLHIAPFMGMLTGLALLKFFGFYLQRTHHAIDPETSDQGAAGDIHAFDSFQEIARVEWDTLLFFFGVIMCVGALSFIGYLGHASAWLYGDLGPTAANILVGILSAILDNIPLMIAVLEMNPDMGLEQWLLITLTAGVGGSLLSIGSAAGVALMGQAHGHYTFMKHLAWTPVIALGYAASIGVHLLLNS